MRKAFITPLVLSLFLAGFALVSPVHGNYIELFRFSQWWNQEPEADLSDHYDVEEDQMLDHQDLLLLMAQWRAQPTPTPTPPPQFTVPLPGAAGSVPLVLVQIPPGSFLMGRYFNEKDGLLSEDPQHLVQIGYSFQLGKYPITQGQWEAITGTTPWRDDQGNLRFAVLDDPDSPAIYISWDSIRGPGGFLEKLNALGHGTFRLPSESEWEYACRAGTTTRFHWGDDLNYEQNHLYSWYDDLTTKIGNRYAPVVGQKLPNPWGLFDMSGNVLEWIEDDYHQRYSTTGPTVSPRPDDGRPWVDSPRASQRMLRGSNYATVNRYTRSATRGGSNNPGFHGGVYGLRVVRVVQ